MLERHRREISLIVAILGIGAVLAVVAPGFFTFANQRDLMLANMPVLIVALGMVLVILTGQIDISVGSQFAICSVATGVFARLGLPMPLAGAAACLVGALMGGINGALVAWVRIPSIVVTLATMVALRDGLRWVTQGAWVQNLPPGFQWFGQSQPASEWITAGCAVLLVVGMNWGLRNLAAGRVVYATGSSPNAARLAGINPRLVVFAVFLLTGALTGFAAVLNAVRFLQIPSNLGMGLELKVIAAVVVGGVAIAGGRGTIAGTLLGLLLLGVIGPALTFLGFSAYWERAIEGGIILAAVSMDVVRVERGNMLNQRKPWREICFPNGEWVLGLALAVELAIFAFVGENFFTWPNFFEVVRLSVELGLLALALTPIMITGGIDLSVGSIMGLSAVVFGVLWRDGGWGVAAAAGAALLLGCLAGLLNAALITRLNLPPLIVTLGSLSLFRGIAEGITKGAENYSGFPAGFLRLGQGYLGGVVPVQLPVLVLAIAAYWVLLHRSAIGRTLYAVGFSPGGARYAGIPVKRRVALLYFLSGAVASLAAIIYVAHLGQAKSDAGTGYELAAITAVVLGGTSVFGGRGTVWGTVLGLFAISVLQNGLRLAALPSEMTGVLTGVVLVLTIGLGRLRGRAVRNDATIDEADAMKNSQLAILCCAVVGGSLIVAATNVWLVRSLRPADIVPARTLAKPGKRPVIAMMPKSKGDPYFISCRAGAEEAAREAGADLIWDGPTGLDAAKQNEVVEGWITRGVDAIAVSVENSAGISTVLRKARARGIKVVTWDADAAEDARDYFINQATPEGIGYTLVDEGARLLGGKGEFAIITGPLSAANQNAWMEFMAKRVAEKYPEMKLAAMRPSDDDRDKAFAETQTILKVYPKVKLIITISAPAVPGSAEAVQQAGRKDVFVIGLSLPNLCKRYVHDGVVQAVVLWNTRDLGYLTVTAAALLVEGRTGKDSLPAGRLGTVEVRGSQVILGKPFIFNKANIDQYNF